MSNEEGIFKLKQDVEDLEFNHKILNTNMRQITASRGIGPENFSSGIQNFKFELSGNRWWRPQNSYMRLRCKLSRNANIANPAQATTAGIPLTVSDGIAPAMGLCGNLYQNMDFKMGDTTVSRVSNNVAQVDTINHRLSKSRSWSKSIGASTNFWDESFLARQNAVCSDGEQSDRKTETLTKSQMAGHDAANTVQYIAANNSVNIVYRGAQPIDLWKAGDLYSDATNAQILDKQVILSVSTANNITWVLILGQTPVAVNNGPVNANIWSRTRVSGSDSRKVSEFELVWQPPLSVFDYDGALPCGKYELSMLPFNLAQMKMNAIESIGLATKAVSDFHFEVNDVYLCIEELEGENCTDMKYILDLSQVRAQEFAFSKSAFGQKSFDVSPSTKSLTIAYQDGRVNSDTRISASKFKIQGSAIPHDAATRINSDYALTLKRQYFSYAGANYPPQDSDPTFNTNIDRTTQRYVESLMQSRAYHEVGGSETIQEFHDAGSYYHQKIYKSKFDGATRAVVYSEFSGTDADAEHARVILFDEYTLVAQITIANGTIKEVQVSDN
jgi:hypothetical protein